MLIEFKNVCKTYISSETVYGAKNIDLAISKGDFIALVGPSGSGKTTLLNLFSGLLLPTSGEILFKGGPVHQLSLEQRTKHRLDHMGFVFQDYQLLPTLTAFENVELPLRLKKLRTEEITKKVEEALGNVGILKMKDRFPHELSGGQQQRVSVARAICSSPELILADEPTANLDSKTAHDIIDLFKKLNQELNITFIFSTHDQRLIDQVKHVIEIRDGELQ